VLDHRGGRLREGPHDGQRAIKIEQVVVGEVLAVQLLGGHHARPAHVALGIERGPLVRVLAVAEHCLA